MCPKKSKSVLIVKHRPMVKPMCYYNLNRTELLVMIMQRRHATGYHLLYRIEPKTCKNATCDKKYRLQLIFVQLNSPETTKGWWEFSVRNQTYFSIKP